MTTDNMYNVYRLKLRVTVNRYRSLTNGQNLKETNKAVYMAALVTDGWAGAENLENVTLLRTDDPTDGPKSRL